MELKRVVVTGLGAVTPLGNNTEDTWNNLVAGVSGATPTCAANDNTVSDHTLSTTPFCPSHFAGTIL